MKNPSRDTTDDRRRLAQLRALLAQPTDREKRPCPGCVVPCPCYGSRTCSCSCSSACPHAPRQMSSDPDNHPIEPHILPLVYALYCLRGCTPCWSSEGRLDGAGRLVRRPAVRFFTDSDVYPDVISAYLRTLAAGGMLSSPWDVSVVRREWPERTTFVLQPEPCSSEAPDLEQLWEDVSIIAEPMALGVRVTAREFMCDIVHGRATGQRAALAAC